MIRFPAAIQPPATTGKPENGTRTPGTTTTPGGAGPLPLFQ